MICLLCGSKNHINLKNADVQKINDIIINIFFIEQHKLFAFNEVKGDTHHLYK